MSNREFWEEEPELLWAYRKSYMDKFKINKEINNTNAWLIGLYVFDGISKAIYNNFGRKDGRPALPYIEKPYDLNARPKSKEEREREEMLSVEEQIKERNRKIKEMLKKK